jgi:hypothetical protein
MKTKATKVPVSERAVIARINRALARQDMKLKTARSQRMQIDVGDWYVINTRLNGVVQPYKHMPLEDIARDVGVLKDWETVVFER